jgi:hypothetical protein
MQVPALLARTGPLQRAALEKAQKLFLPRRFHAARVQEARAATAVAV